MCQTIDFYDASDVTVCSENGKGDIKRSIALVRVFFLWDVCHVRPASNVIIFVSCSIGLLN